MTTKNRAQSLSITLLLASTMLSSLPYAAQAATAEKGSPFLEEIVVTSTKVGATLVQDTPAAITALSASALEDIQYENISNLSGIVPSLSVNRNGEYGRLYLRGVGTNLDFPGSDPSVAVYLDGVYLARPAIVFANFIDIERVEVLRGPQGTLYGRNAAGGVVSIVSKQPGNELEGKLTGEYGSYNKWRASGNVSGPIVEDKVAASMSVMHTERDGYSKNANPLGPDRLNDDNTTSARGMLRITPQDNLEITLAADYFYRDLAYAYRPLFVDVFGAPVDLGAQQFTDPYKVNMSISDPASTVKAYGFSGQVKWDLNDQLSLTSITAYRETSYDLRVDPDFTELDIYVSNVLDKQRQFSQELQLQGKTDLLTWVAGLYYFHERGLMDNYIELPGPGVDFGFGPTFANQLDVLAHTDAYAVFVQGTYSVTDRLHATAGIRYSYEKKDIDKSSWLEAGGVRLPFGDFTQQQDDNWKAWTPKFALDYKIDDTKLLYGSVTKGFKSGGFNFSALQSSFDPESLWAYEVGIKTDWFENLLRVNLSAFYYDYKNLQVQGFVITDTASAAVVEISNAADAKIKGIELELTAQPTKELLLTAMLGYLDATYGNYITARSIDPETPVDVTGNRLNNAPKWTYSLAAQYTVDIDKVGAISFRGDFRWQDDVFYTVYNDAAVGQSSYGLLNAMISWEPTDTHWKLSIYGRNLTDKVYYMEKPDFSPTGIGGSLPEPRVFGITGNYQF